MHKKKDKHVLEKDSITVSYFFLYPLFLETYKYYDCEVSSTIKINHQNFIVQILLSICTSVYNSDENRKNYLGCSD